MSKTVVVTGSGRNLYKISEYSGWFYIYQVRVGLLTNTNESIGRASTLADALELIKSYSGRRIKEIS